MVNNPKRRLTRVQPSLIKCKKENATEDPENCGARAKLRAICAIGACQNVPVQGFWIKLPTNRQFIFLTNSAWNLFLVHFEACIYFVIIFHQVSWKEDGHFKNTLLCFPQFLLLTLETETKKAVIPRRRDPLRSWRIWEVDYSEKMWKFNFLFESKMVSIDKKAHLLQQICIWLPKYPDKVWPCPNDSIYVGIWFGRKTAEKWPVQTIPLDHSGSE